MAERYVLPTVLEVIDYIPSLTQLIQQATDATLRRDDFEHKSILEAIDSKVDHLQQLVLKLSITASPAVSMASQNVCDQFRKVAKQLHMAAELRTADFDTLVAVLTEPTPNHVESLSGIFTELIMVMRKDMGLFELPPLRHALRRSQRKNRPLYCLSR